MIFGLAGERVICALADLYLSSGNRRRNVATHGDKQLDQPFQITRRESLDGTASISNCNADLDGGNSVVEVQREGAIGDHPDDTLALKRNVL